MFSCRIASRRLVLVDIENLAGGAVTEIEDARDATRLVDSAIGARLGDHVILGVSHASAEAAGFGWEGPMRLLPPRSGADGADLALLDVLRHERIADRFDNVVIASGDGIFSDAAAELTAAGVHVTVLAPADGCSASLRLAATSTILFRELAPVREVVA